MIHTNDVTADSLDKMLTRFTARGYSFVTLDEVMKDDAYQTKITNVFKAGPTWPIRWAKSKGMDVDIFKDEPEPAKWIMDLYKQR